MLMEWSGKRKVLRLEKYYSKRLILWHSDFLIRLFDNAALKEYLIPSAVHKSHMIPYPGDYVSVMSLERDRSVLTICRIEPENNVEMLIEGFLASRLGQYFFVIGTQVSLDDL